MLCETFHNIPQPIITFQLHFTISLKKTIFRYLKDPSGLSTLNAIPSPQVGPPALMCWKLMKPWIVEIWSKSCFAILNYLKFWRLVFSCVCFFFMFLFLKYLLQICIFWPFQSFSYMFDHVCISSILFLHFLLVSRLHRLLTSWLAAR
jgi:hypothetical protein